MKTFPARLDRVLESAKINPITLPDGKDPLTIELQELNVIVISLGNCMGLPYVMVSRKDEDKISLYNPMSQTVLRKFAFGTTVGDLNNSLSYGRVVAWYGRIGDYVRKQNVVQIPTGGGSGGKKR